MASKEEIIGNLEEISKIYALQIEIGVCANRKDIKGLKALIEKTDKEFWGTILCDAVEKLEIDGIDKKIEAYEMIHDKYPDNTKTLITLGDIYYKQNRYGDAKQKFARLKQLNPRLESHLRISVKEIEEVIRQTKDIVSIFANIYKELDNIGKIHGGARAIDLIGHKFRSLVKYFGSDVAFDDAAKDITAYLVNLVEYQICKTADALVAKGVEWRNQADYNRNKTSKSRWRRFTELVLGDPEFEGKFNEGRQWFKAVKRYSKVHKAMPRRNSVRTIADDKGFRINKSAVRTPIDSYGGRLEPDEKPNLE